MRLLCFVIHSPYVLGTEHWSSASALNYLTLPQAQSKCSSCCWICFACVLFRSFLYMFVRNIGPCCFFSPCLVLVARWYWAYRTSPEEFPWFQLDGIFEISWSFFKLWYSSAVMPSALGFSLLGNFITPSISWLVTGLLWFLTIF